MRAKLMYKGYIGCVEQEEDSTYFGLVVAVKAVITFYGDTLQEAEQEFHESIDIYLEWCEERGKEPEKTQPGKLSLVIEHEAMIARAEQQGTEPNSSIFDLFKKVVSF
jgi:predicted HicB family RNase H-like nuclease